MNNDYTSPIPASSTSSEPPRRAKGKKTGLKIAGASTLALLVGIGLGSASAGGTPEPEVITETKTVTETVEVETTPESCIDSTVSGRALVEQVAAYLGAESDAWTAASTFNAATLSAASDLKQIEADKLVEATASYLADAEICKGAGS